MERNWSLALSPRQALVIILIAAVLIRIPAILWSKGFMASDDHYETVEVAYQWLRTGALDGDGSLTWKNHPTEEISRFPLYAMTLYGIMRAYHAIGVESLDTIMYGIRAFHAILSLLTVVGMFGIVWLTTRSSRWGMIGGLVGGLHFALPYLGVRTLIEVVSGDVWLMALLAVYLYETDRRDRWLVVAGLLTGLAWMVRFQIAAAVIPLPLIFWWQYRSWRPVVAFLAGGALMVAVTAVVDWSLIGIPLGTFFNHLAQGFKEGELYRTPRLLYPLLLAGLAVPPLSVAALVWMTKRAFWSKHLVLIWSSIVFVLLHTLVSNRQERFILPILPAFLTLVVLAIAFRWERATLERKEIAGWRWLVWPSLAINLLLLAVLTCTYSRKGVVEPLVLIEREQREASVLLVSPEQSRIFPFAYGGFAPIRRQYIQSWSDLPIVSRYLTSRDSLDFVVVYPPEEEDIPRYRDSLERHFGPLRNWGRVEPSLLDLTLHRLNPGHNRLNLAILYRAVRE